MPLFRIFSSFFLLDYAVGVCCCCYRPHLFAVLNQVGRQLIPLATSSLYTDHNYCLETHKYANSNFHLKASKSSCRRGWLLSACIIQSLLLGFFFIFSKGVYQTYWIFFNYTHWANLSLKNKINYISINGFYFMKKNIQVHIYLHLSFYHSSSSRHWTFANCNSRFHSFNLWL